MSRFFFFYPFFFFFFFFFKSLNTPISHVLKNISLSINVCSFFLPHLYFTSFPQFSSLPYFLQLAFKKQSSCCLFLSSNFSEYVSKIRRLLPLVCAKVSNTHCLQQNILLKKICWLVLEYADCISCKGE